MKLQRSPHLVLPGVPASTYLRLRSEVYILPSFSHGFFTRASRSTWQRTCGSPSKQYPSSWRTPQQSKAVQLASERETEER